MSHEPGRIVLMTSDHLRHRWVAERLSEAAQLAAVIAEQKPADSPAQTAATDLETRDYFRERSERERHWFGSVSDFDALAPRTLRLPWRGINTPETLAFVRGQAPDLIILFGCGIIRQPLLGEFDGRIVNMHLGLSPIIEAVQRTFGPWSTGYRNVGTTVHHATLAVDGGAILGQVRPEPREDDSAHDLGCKSVMAGRDILCRLAAIGLMPPGLQ